MSLNLPLVSIVITCYNREKTIGRAIDSALAQDYPNLEIIVSDNCSTDNSNIIISKYLKDSRIKYFRNEENVGMFNNFSISFEKRASGDFVSIVNSDDELINSRFISQSIDLVNKYENIVIVKSDSKLTSYSYTKYQQNSIYSEFYRGLDFLKEINFQNDFGWAGILVNRSILNEMKIF